MNDDGLGAPIEDKKDGDSLFSQKWALFSSTWAQFEAWQACMKGKDIVFRFIIIEYSSLMDFGP